MSLLLGCNSSHEKPFSSLELELIGLDVNGDTLALLTSNSSCQLSVRNKSQHYFEKYSGEVLSSGLNEITVVFSNSISVQICKSFRWQENYFTISIDSALIQFVNNPIHIQYNSSNLDTNIFINKVLNEYELREIDKDDLIHVQFCYKKDSLELESKINVNYYNSGLCIGSKPYFDTLLINFNEDSIWFIDYNKYHPTDIKNLNVQRIK